MNVSVLTGDLYWTGLSKRMKHIFGDKHPIPLPSADSYDDFQESDFEMFMDVFRRGKKLHQPITWYAGGKSIKNWSYLELTSFLNDNLDLFRTQMINYMEESHHYPVLEKEWDNFLLLIKKLESENDVQEVFIVYNEFCKNFNGNPASEDKKSFKRYFKKYGIK